MIKELTKHAQKNSKCVFPQRLAEDYLYPEGTSPVLNSPTPVPVQTVTGSSNFDGYVVLPLGVFPPEKEYIPVPLQKVIKKEEAVYPLRSKVPEGTNKYPLQKIESSDFLNWNGYTEHKSQYFCDFLTCVRYIQFILLCILLSQIVIAAPAERTPDTSHCYLLLPQRLLITFYPSEIHLYPVRGKDSRQIAGSIQHHGPHDGQNELRYTGYYKGAVSLSGSTLRYSSSVELPCLRRMSKDIRKQWRRYIKTLARHELNHHRLFMAGIREYRRSAGEKSESTWQRTVNSMRARDRMWDSIDIIPPFDKFQNG